MGERHISFVTENNLCFACGACSLVCPADAIGFEITNAGRLHPVINDTACIRCGACYQICPGYDAQGLLFRDRELDPFAGRAIASYLGRSLDQTVFQDAQSGGMVTELLSYLLQQNLIEAALVVTTPFSTHAGPSASFVTSSDDLPRSQKCKYSATNLLSALKDAGRFKGPIAIVGLPCRLQGLVALAGRDSKIHANVRYRVGLICDGVLSAVANDYFSQGSVMPHRIVWKHKHHPDYLHANVVIEYENGTLRAADRLARFLLKG